MPSKTTVYVNSFARGAIVVPGGRTGKVGPGSVQISDGSTVPIGGSGYVELGVAPTSSVIPSPVSGAAGATAVTATASVTNTNPHVVGSRVSGNVIFTVNGNGATAIAVPVGIDTQTAVAVIPASAFPTPVVYTIDATYEGDETFAPAAASTIFTAT